LLEIAGRTSGWSVVIALVGGGQEIHDGEAGVFRGGSAPRRAGKTWGGWASPEADRGGGGGAGPPPSPGHSTAESSLLAKSRSHRAQRIAEWVTHVVSGDAGAAAQVAVQFGKFPIALTRDLRTAREWLRGHCIDDLRRAGLVASSGAMRHRAFGLEVSSGFRQ